MVCHKPGNLIKIVCIFCVYCITQMIFLNMSILKHYSCHETLVSRLEKNASFFL